MVCQHISLNFQDKSGLFPMQIYQIVKEIFTDIIIAFPKMKFAFQTFIFSRSKNA